MAARVQRKARKLQGRGNGPAGSIAPVSDGQILALLTEGHKAHLSGDVEFAEQRYRQVLSLRPDVADAYHLLGVIHLKRGEAEKAVELLARAIAIDPKPEQFHTNYGAALHHAGRSEEAIEVYRRAVARSPDSIDAYKNLSVLLNSQGKVEEAVEVLHEAARRNPGAARVHKLLGNLYLQHNNLEEAAESYRKCVEIDPSNDVMRSDFGYVLGKLGRHQEAVDVLMPAYQRGTELPDLCNNLGNSLRHLDRLDEAEEALNRAIELDPKRWQFESNIAGVYFQQGRVNKALETFERLYREHPDELTTMTDLAICYVRTGRAGQAIPMFKKVLEKRPDDVKAWNSLGVAYGALLYHKEAEDAYRMALKYAPKDFHANDNLAITLKALNKYDEANLAAHATLALPDYRPSRFLNTFQIFHNTCDYDGMRQLGDIEALCEQVAPLTLTGAIFDMMVHADTPESTRRLVALHRKWGMAIERQAAERPLPPLERRPPRRKLRIGFLSSDLRSHAVGRHLMPLLRNYDRDRLEIYGYTPWDYPNDPNQREIMRLVAAFRPLSNMRVREIAELIRRDEIDILFDFNGHTLGSKAEALAYRPAPIQISWLGYPFSSGLKDVDYFLLDDRICPSESGLMLEKPLLMPESWVAFAEYPDVPVADTLPVEVNGYITFGTLNNPYKYTPQTIAAWARVMKNVPKSRMIFVRPEVKSRVLCVNIAKEFRRHGVDPERLFFFDNQTQKVNFVDCYNQIDMTLDTFPVTGGTTTCDATWMGVPVVTRVGQAIHQRISYAILDRIGLGELCTWTIDEFVERASALAHSTDDLKFLRQNLRDSVQSSIFFDWPRHAQQFSDTMWSLAKQHGLV